MIFPHFPPFPPISSHFPPLWCPLATPHPKPVRQKWLLGGVSHHVFPIFPHKHKKVSIQPPVPPFSRNRHIFEIVSLQNPEMGNFMALGLLWHYGLELHNLKSKRGESVCTAPHFHDIDDNCTSVQCPALPLFLKDVSCNPHFADLLVGHQ